MSGPDPNPPPPRRDVSPRHRDAPLEMAPDQFRALGHRMVERVAGYLETLRGRPVTPGETPAQVRAALGGGSLPERGADPQALLDRAADLLIGHSLYNGHPRFFGYITSSAAPIGALGDLLVSAVNPNVGGWQLAPIASEIEVQTVRWIAELIGYPATCGGLLVSGGNVANFVAFVAARHAKAPWDVRARGMMAGGQGALRVYASKETHTWIQKAADLFGLGTESVRWIDTTADLRMDTRALRAAIAADRAAGDVPLAVVGTAGSVSTGAIDPLAEIATICREQGIWFHVDGAYGGIAAALPEASADLKALSEADSVAVDPHKWLYAPLEAGCTLVRDGARLRDAFSYMPSYYHFGEEQEEPPVNFYEYGLQNSRGFRALKVWLGLQHAGREGCVRSIRDDIALAAAMYRAVEAHPELEAFTLGLSIATFRYVPPGFDRAAAGAEEYLDTLNERLLTRLKDGGRAFLSNAVVRERFLLRACIVNFRTTLDDVQAVPEIVAEIGRELDREQRPASLARE
jgi:aromatic-L-amino-acid decarboxylase